MRTIDQIDLPAVPDDLVETTDAILARPYFTNFRKHVPDNLHHYLQTIFKQPIDAQYVIVAEGFAPHIDVTGRDCGYNYILEPGGDNVLTTIWDDDLTPFHQITCETKKWYRVPCGHWHSVHGINPGTQRIMITVTYHHDKRTGGGRCHPLVKDPQQWLATMNQTASATKSQSYHI